MYNHESWKVYYNLRSMHYIHTHNNNTVTGTTNRTNSLLQDATNSTISPRRIIFSKLDTSQISRTIRFTVNYINSCLKLGKLSPHLVTIRFMFNAYNHNEPYADKATLSPYKVLSQLN